MSTTGMMQRCWEHDYCSPSFYMITVVTEPRRGCLSELQGTASVPLLQVQISRRISPGALAARKEELLYASEHGAVLVSPCISPGEKEIARAALEAGRPLIVLLENGFAPFYKPAGRYFQACASGRLLMVAPFPYHRQRRSITREQCLALNAWARTIAEIDAA